MPIDDKSIVFVIKPTDYTLPVDQDMLPRFYYINRPAGSSPNLKLRYRGIDPTGPLRDSVDFPLKKADEPRKFDVIVFTDPQPESQVEIDHPGRRGPWPVDLAQHQPVGRPFLP